LKKEDNEFSNKLLASKLHVIQSGSLAEPATAKSNGKLGFMVLLSRTTGSQTFRREGRGGRKQKSEGARQLARERGRE
jgi:hypothetical protein